MSGLLCRSPCFEPPFRLVDNMVHALLAALAPRRRTPPSGAKAQARRTNTSPSPTRPKALNPPSAAMRLLSPSPHKVPLPLVPTAAGASPAGPAGDQPRPTAAQQPPPPEATLPRGRAGAAAPSAGTAGPLGAGGATGGANVGSVRAEESERVNAESDSLLQQVMAFSKESTKTPSTSGRRRCASHVYLLLFPPLPLAVPTSTSC